MNRTGVNSRGMAADLTVADPWELAGMRFGVEVVQEDSEGRMLARVEPALDWKGTQYHFLVLERRHRAGSTGQPPAPHSMECAGIGVSTEQAAGTSPWGADRWRGGLALLGTLSTGA